MAKLPLGLAIGLIVAVVYGISLAVWIATLQTSTNSANDIALRLRGEVSKSLRNRLQDRISVAETTTRMMAREFRTGVWTHPDRSDPRGNETLHFLTAFRDILYAGKTVTSVWMTDKRGLGQGIYNNFDFTVAGWWDAGPDPVTGEPSLWDWETYPMDDPREGQVKQLVSYTTPYDGTQFIYFTLCNKSDPNSNAWTPMYTMGTVGVVFAMVSQCHTAWRPDGSWIGVVGIDMTTGFIGSILAANTNRGLLSFAIDGTSNAGLGVFLGSSTGEVIMKCIDPTVALEDCNSVNQTFKLPSDSTDLTIRHYDQQLRTMYGGWDTMPDLYTQIGSDLISVETVSSNNLQWRIVLVVPQKSYLDNVMKNRDIMIAVQVICAVVTVIVCGLFVHSVRRPLAAVIASMEELQRFETKDDADLGSTVEDSMLLEISQMQQSNRALGKAMSRAKAYVPQSLLAELQGIDEDEEETAEDIHPRGNGVLISQVQPSSRDRKTSYAQKSTVGDNRSEPRSVSSRSSRHGSGKVLPNSANASSAGHLVANAGMIGMLRKRVSILCLNIRDFHAVAFPLAPELVAKLMTKIVGVVAATVKEQRGVLDFFQGDRFCISFNAVTNLVTHVRRAVSCAVILHTKLKALSDGSLPVDSTCGLSVGQAIVGNVGSEEVKRFGIISPVYSQATKLERQCKKYSGVPILAVATMMDECQGIVKYDHVDVVAFAEGASVASTVSPQSPPIPLDGVRGAAAQQAQKRRIVSCPRVLLSNESEEEWMYELKQEEGAQNHNDRFIAWTEGKEVARLVDQRQYTEPPVEGLPTPQELLQGWLNAAVDGKTHVSASL